MAGEPFVVCGTKKIRWNHFFWGIVEACTRVDDSMKGELSAILDSIYGMSTFWLQISTALEFAESKHRKWLPEDSALFEKWIAFLNFMEKYGLRIFRVQLAGIAAIVMSRVSRTHTWVSLTQSSSSIVHLISSLKLQGRGVIMHPLGYQIGADVTREFNTQMWKPAREAHRRRMTHPAPSPRIFVS